MIPPASHGQDVNYTFYTGPDPSIVNDTAAIIHQKYITNYVIYGEPGCAKGACFLGYGSDVNTLSVNTTEIKDIKDPWAAGGRCDLLELLAAYT